jgi:hypothetical protein
MSKSVSQDVPICCLYPFSAKELRLAPANAINIWPFGCNERIENGIHHMETGLPQGQEEGCRPPPELFVIGEAVTLQQAGC